MPIRHLSNKYLAIVFLFVYTLPTSNVVAQDCKAKVNVNTNNTQAIVFIDTMMVGKGNVQTELSLGTHVIRIKEAMYKWGQKEIVDTVSIADCTKPLTFDYNFTSEKEQPTNLDIYKVDGKNGKSFFTSTTFKLLLGSAAVLGGVAAYYKIKADSKYDEYLKSKDVSMLNEVDRLDLISGISFGLLQINFGYLIYKFLTD